MRELFKPASLAKPVEPCLCSDLPVFSITDYSISQKHLISPIFGSVFQSSRVRVELQLSSIPALYMWYSTTAVRQFRQAEPVFWGTMRTTGYMQIKQPGPAEPRVSKRFRVYSAQQHVSEVWSSPKAMALYQQATTQRNIVLALNSTYKWALVKKINKDPGHS